MSQSILRATALGLALLTAPPATAQSASGLNSPVDKALEARQESVLIGRPFAQPFVCSEHFGEPWQTLGNALGRDCYALGAVPVGEGFIAGLYAGDGARNAQHFSHGAELLAPLDAMVVETAEGADVNTPGLVRQGSSGHVVFRSGDGTHVVYAHVRGLRVAAGQSVRRGQVVGVVAASGVSRQPHVHIGAWTGAQPLQPRFDLLTSAPAAQP